MKSWLPQLHFLQSSISPHNILGFFYLREGVLSNCLFLQRAYLYCHKWQCWFSQSMYASMAEASSHNIVAIITILQQKKALLHVSTTHCRIINIDNILKIIMCIFITAPLPISFLCSGKYAAIFLCPTTPCTGR